MSRLWQQWEFLGIHQSHSAAIKPVQTLPLAEADDLNH
jgi:hypothetical protein